MSDQLGEDVPSETAQAWDSVLRVREPVAWAGPFVMNTRQEVEQAFDDYRSGRF